MDKCEKDERFEEAATARDRILKLKKLENKRTLEDLRLRQEEEMKFLIDKIEEERQQFRNEFNSTITSLKEKNNAQIEEMSNKHTLEKESVVEKFNSTYPDKPKYSPEVLNLKKIMEGHIKNQEYEKANEIKIKIIKLCEQQVLKHEVNTKNNKLTSELEKLKSKQDTEMYSLQLKQKSVLNELQKKFKSEEDKQSLKNKNKIKELENSHLLQINEQQKINKKNLNTKITVNRMMNNSSMVDNSKLSKLIKFQVYNFN